jgi:hypothetical protein
MGWVVVALSTFCRCARCTWWCAEIKHEGQVHVDVHALLLFQPKTEREACCSAAPLTAGLPCFRLPLFPSACAEMNRLEGLELLQLHQHPQSPQTTAGSACAPWRWPAVALHRPAGPPWRRIAAPRLRINRRRQPAQHAIETLHIDSKARPVLHLL